MTIVKRVHGAPGTGKTYTLLNAVEEHVEADDVGMFEFYMANFTRNGRSDTADDLVERGIFDLSEFPDEIGEDDLRGRCRTIHSIALQCCPEIKNPKEQVVTMAENPEFYHDFCHERGLNFEPEETNPLELGDGDGQDRPLGNQLFDLNQELHLRYLPTIDRLDKLHQCETSVDLPNARVRELLREWAEYKQEAADRRFEHHDYVDLCLENEYTPDVDLLCIDEFQDLSPVEYALYKLWRDEGEIDWIYIAGDVNQSIYSFRRATPYYFAETDVDDLQYLTESRRCPVEVSSVARGILEGEPSITRNVFETAEVDGRRPAGQADMVTMQDAADLASAVRDAVEAHDIPDTPTGEDEAEPAVVYLLTRTNWQLRVLSYALQQEGVPFSGIGDKMDPAPWPDELVDCLLVLRAVRRGSAAVRETVDTLLEMAHNTEARRERLETADVEAKDFRVDYRESDAVYFPEQIEAAFPGRDAYEIVDQLDISEYQQQMLRGALDSETSPYPEHIQVGTIHEAKGLEAPCVFLFAETTETIRERYRSGESRAEEHRIMYVGATRASETLYVCDGFFDGPTNPIFSNGLPANEQGQSRQSFSADD